MKKITNKFIITMLLFSVSTFLFADDTDIFDKEVPRDTNILFVMDMSGSMNWGFTDGIIPANPADSRKNILQSALSGVLTDPLLTDINIGIASFAGNASLGTTSQVAHGISYPVSPIDGDAQTQLNQNPLFAHPNTSYLPIGGGMVSRGYIGTAVPTTWAPYGGTPIVDALYEAALYFRGLDVFWGFQDPSNIRSAHPSSYTGLIENVTTTSTNYQCNTVSCSGSGCNSTHTCSTNPTTNYCSTPTCGSNCTFHTGQSCTNTCPASIYDEFGACANPVTTCVPDNYYSCDGPNSTTCSHQVCGDVTTTSTSPVGNAVYNSPITTECVNNAIILLSDGAPSLNNSATRIKNLVGASYHNNCDAGGTDGRCGKELTKFLANEDNNSSVSGDQFVNTHTIGLALSNPSAAAYLKDLASNGGGQFVTANSAASLAAALKNTMTYAARARSFSSPTYSTASATSFSHGNKAYLPVFDRSIGPVWSGNLKKYQRLDGVLKDADGNNAIDASGALKNEARDFGSSVASTQSVQSGGVANKIDPVKRSNGTTPIYTDNGSSGTAANLKALNNGLPNALFEKTPGSVSTAYKNKLVDFILGKKPDGSARHHMGDVIHSKPIHVSYGAGNVLFVGTNEGYLHAIDENSGEELFAFMPSELLKNIDTQYRNDALDKHVYGVDGPITLWHDDTDKDNIVDPGETAILYFGLRRGGKSYYALDVSTRTSPNLRWRINNSGQFNRLGFSWSQPTVSKMRYGATTYKPVLVFGGGYIDDNGDYGSVETDGSTITGTEVFIVDAMTGAKVWKISDSATLPANALKYAKPAKIRVIDLNRDGSLDRLYYSDTGGNIWRVDFGSTNLSTAKVMHFANLGGSAATGRKFFTEPDVAIFKKGTKYLASISIGSGERPQPLDASRDDHFFVLFDNKVISTPDPLPSTITIGNLANATGGPVNAFAANKKGWFMDLTELNGEKVLSTALTYQNMVFFSSFGTTTINQTVCDVSNINQARLYALDLLTGGPVLDLDGDGNNNKSTKSTHGEIPGTTQVLFKEPKSGAGTPCSNGDCARTKELVLGKGKAVTLPPVNELQRVYWIDED